MTLTTSILKGSDNNFETTSEMANALGTDLFQEGVVGAITNTSGVAPATGSFAVNAQGTPDMTVAVSAGEAWVSATPTGQGSQLLRVDSSTIENVTINANSTGSTRYDNIYIAIDATNAAAPNSSGSNVATLVVSRSTSSVTDNGTPPTYGYRIAKVTVANGAVSITNGNIADVRRRVMLKDGTVLPETLVDGTGTAWEWQDWTPTYSNISKGDGTVSAKYTQIGKTVIAYWELVCGATTSIASNATITLPVTASSRHGSGYTKVGDGMLEDSGTALYQIEAYTLASASTATIRYPSIATHSGTVYMELTGTIPITEATGDSWGISFVYEAA
jgi:hypothetical protein